MASVAEGVRSSETTKRFGDELYGLDALRRARNREEWLAALAMIDEQEAAHILEGLDLLQWDNREFFFDGQFLIDPYSGLSQVETCQNAIDAAQDQAPVLMKWLYQDKHAAVEADRLMREGEIGQGFWRLLPYAYELDDTAARAMGMWPEEQRSYLHFYRKTRPDKLEFTVITIDRVDLEWHRTLLESQIGSNLADQTSYELTGVLVPSGILTTPHDRDTYLLSRIGQKSTLASKLSEAQTFVSTHREAIHTITQLYESLVTSEKQRRLNATAMGALIETLELTRQLGMSEQWDLAQLASSPDFDSDHHSSALRLLINVRRYGIWHYLRQVSRGDAVTHTLSPQDVRMYAQRAALTTQTMPGCPGGFGMEWHGGETHIGPCGGPCRRKAVVVGIGSWCHECIIGPNGC